MTTYFTSDTHFGHKNICGPNGFEEKRKAFENSDDMDEHIINVWNKQVNPEDIVYHLGDFFLYTKYQKLLDTIDRLNGKIIWIAGNHDSHKNGRRINRYYLKKADESGPKVTFLPHGCRLIIDGYTLFLNHYGQLLGGRPKVFSIHGHIHAAKTMFQNHINIGLDNIESEFEDLEFGQPISLERLMDCIKEREAFMAVNNLFTKHDSIEATETIQKKEPQKLEELIQLFEKEFSRTFDNSLEQSYSQMRLITYAYESLKEIQADSNSKL